MSRGQSLVELALCAPIVLLLALGAVATMEVADARAGLEAATSAAAGAAARAPDSATALTSAQQRFATVVAGYPLNSTSLQISVGDFSRGGNVTATSTGAIDLGWAAGLVFPGRMSVASKVVLQLEPWRTHRTSS